MSDDRLEQIMAEVEVEELAEEEARAELERQRREAAEARRYANKLRASWEAPHKDLGTKKHADYMHKQVRRKQQYDRMTRGDPDD